MDWAVSVAVCVLILSATGMQDWIARLFGSHHTRQEREGKIALLESRIENWKGQGGLMACVF